MKEVPQQQRAAARTADLKAQLTLDDDPVFPFSSPIPDHRSSTASNVSDYSLHSHTLPSSKTTTSIHSRTNQAIAGANQETPLKDDGRGVHTTCCGAKDDRFGKEMHIRTKPRPNLHIVTKPQQIHHGQGRLRLNHVIVRRPQEVRNAALSAVSHEGIKALPTPLSRTLPSQAMSALKDRAHRTGTKVSSRVEKSKMKHKLGRKKSISLSTKSSVIFGLSVPEHEAKMHGHMIDNNSTVTLITLQTPHIVITPVEEEPRPLYGDPRDEQLNPNLRQISPSSLYSSISLDESPQNDHPPPPADSHHHRRDSSDSQQQTLVGSSIVTRPKSQGWWNLVVSPILSRMGTLKSHRSRRCDSIPPVPEIKTMTGKDDHNTGITLGISPETPRRLGLAEVRASSWSQWTEIDDREDLAGDSPSEIEQNVPTQAHDCLAHALDGSARLGLTNEVKGKGLAAEYYRACAIEQLSGVPYFECINHSCAQHLPKLKSIFNMPGRPVYLDGLGMAGSEVDFTNDSGHPRGNMSRVEYSQDTDKANKASHYANHCITKHNQNPQSSDDSQTDHDELVSPNVRQAKTALFSRVTTVHPRDHSPVPAPKQNDKKIKKLKISPAVSMVRQPAVESPGPISPDAIRAIAPIGALDMAPMPSLSADRTGLSFPPASWSNQPVTDPYQHGPGAYLAYGSISQQQFFVPPPQHHGGLPNAHSCQADGRNLNGIARASPSIATGERGQKTNSCIQITTVNQHIEEKNEFTTGEKHKGKLDLFSCFRKRKAKQAKTRRRFIGIFVVLLLVIVGCILFAIFFIRGNGNGIDNPVDSQWLNLTGFPPLPTGISMIAQPNLAASQNRCTEPTTLWSCSLPVEDQSSIGSNKPDQPNFRFQIRFRNGTVPANMTVPLNKRAETPLGGSDFAPNPSAPGKLDQIFLGNTTDNITKPFDGETTPFFITFMNADVVGSSANSTSARKASKRQSSNNNSLNASIPPPAIDSDGTAAPATLLPTSPFPFSQPLKLYNRGRRDEHYGFYVYYDKSIFLSGIVLQPNSSTAKAIPADQTGGSPEQSATVRCTWSQTRYLVQIYTNPNFGATLLAGPASTNSTGTSTSSTTTALRPFADSATLFSRPGSFPYPTTITLDRHGGDINKKLVYCYGMANTTIVTTAKVLVPEFRAFGGVLVNPAPQLVNSISGGTSFDSSAGGIDGGTGGCSCSWQNWT